MLVPDFFNGNGLPPDVVPTDTEEKKEHAQKFFDSVASLDANLPKLLAIRREISVRFPEAKNHCGCLVCAGEVSWPY